MLTGPQRRDICIREWSHGFCHVASLAHACDRYRGMGGFSVKLIFILNFLKEPHGPWMPCNHFCIHLKSQKTGTSAKATNLIEQWMIRCDSEERGPMTNVHDWSDLRSLSSSNLAISFSSRKKSMWNGQTENPHHEPYVWVFSILAKTEELLNQKGNIERQWFSSDSHHGTYSLPTASGFFKGFNQLQWFIAFFQCSSSVSVSGKWSE